MKINEKENKVGNESENNELLKKSIIEQQDLLIYYSQNSFEECTRSDEFFGITTDVFENLIETIVKDEELLDKISTPNILLMIEDLDVTKEVIERLKDIYLDRIENGDNMNARGTIEFEALGAKSYSVDRAFLKFTQKQTDKIVEITQNKFSSIKDSDIQKMFEKEGLLLKSNFLEYYQKGDISEDKIKYLKEQLQKHGSLNENFNFGMLQDDIFSLGEEFVEKIIKYPNISYKVVMLHDNNKELFNVFKQIYENYNNTKSPYETLQVMEALTYYLPKQCYNIDFKEKGAVSYEMLDDITACSIMHFKDKVSSWIKKSDLVDYNKDYVETQNEKYDELFKNEKDFAKRKDILMKKYFSMSLNESEKFLKSYGEDIESIKMDLESSDLETIKRLKTIVCMKKEDDTNNRLDTLYNSIDKQISPMSCINMEKNLLNAYAKTFTDILGETDNQIQNELIRKDDDINEKLNVVKYKDKDIPVIKADKKFAVLVHSSDSGFIGKKTLKNNSFVDSFEKGEDSSNHIISSAYINQDFMGCAPVNENGVMYGFTNIPSEKITMMGTSDINSFVRAFGYCAKDIECRSAKSLSFNSRRVYSEVGIERDKTKPDYIIIFDDTTKEVLENSYKAALEYGIPIYSIDKSEVEKEQINKLKLLLNDFEETKNTEVLKDIITNYETNASGWLLNKSKDISLDESATSSIDNTRFEKDFDDIGKDIIKSIYTNLEEFTKTQDKVDIEQYLEKIRGIIDEEKKTYDNTSDSKPITKTEMKLDFSNILGVSEKILFALEDVSKYSRVENEVSIKALVAGAIDDILPEDIEEIYGIRRENIKNQNIDMEVLHE
ncbi:MAG: hypothetical protein RSE57_05370 [Clostridia bacterium]